jgi:hypothetical protein
MTFALSNKEKELLVKINSSLLLKLDNCFITLYKEEGINAVSELSLLLNDENLTEYKQVIYGLINKIRPTNTFM